MNPTYQICTRCVMDTTDRHIAFDSQGVCNHCREYEAKIRPTLLSSAQAAAKLAETIAAMKTAGRGRRYDCLLGLSGGADSSYLALLAWRQGLRTLVVHLDNGWDSELAVKNIENIIRKTGFDYFNHVVDWEEFKDLQLAYLRASVVDIEVVTDHAITALMYRTAGKFGIRYILSGLNHATESIMPRQGWNYQKRDLTNLRAIHRQFGARSLRTYPTLGVYGYAYYHYLRRILVAPLLNLVEYRYENVLQELTHEFGWRFYGRKHGESAFTKFYQAYILPRKFDVDKRRPHLSSLICAGQLTRTEARQRLTEPVYDPEELRRDYEFVTKKLGLTTEQFESIMKQPVIAHEFYATERTDALLNLQKSAGKFILRALGLRKTK